MHKDTTKQTIRFFWRHAWMNPKHVLAIFFSTPLTILLYQFLPPLISAQILTRLSTGNYDHAHWWNSFGAQLVAYVLLLVFGGAVAWRVVDVLDWTLEGRVERSIARQIFGHLMSESANFHANHFGGSLMSQNNKLMGAYIRFADTTVFMIIPMLSGIIWATVILFPRAPQFALLLLGFSLFFIATALLVTKRTRRLSARQAAAESKQTGYLADTITNVMAVKSFAGSKIETAAFNRLTDKTHSRLMTMMRGFQVQQTYFSVINNLTQGLSLVMAVIAVSSFHSNIGTVFLILSYTANITMQLWNFGTTALRNYNRAFGDAQEMVEILGRTPEVLDPEQPEKPRIKNGTIVFDHVDFTHPDSGENEVLFNNLNLSIKAGEKIGLVGHSGSGKTTMTKLLLRFNDIDGGAITIDGQNVAHITQDDLRRHIAYVPQEPLLFHRTIAENIAYGRPGASHEAIREAARKAYAEEFIDKLPQGYDTIVGERGVKLSGGQRQRVVIARAILKNAPILVLDEATSALDSESEKVIQAALWKLMEGRTAIVIAHRLSTIQKMDRIIVLDHGKIIEEGSHQQLLKQGGTYAKLWGHQSGGFIEE